MDNVRKAFVRMVTSGEMEFVETFEAFGRELARYRAEHLEELYTGAYRIAAKITGAGRLEASSRKVKAVEARSMVYLWLCNLGYDKSEICNTAGYTWDTVWREVNNVKNGLEIGYKGLTEHWNEFLNQMEERHGRH